MNSKRGRRSARSLAVLVRPRVYIGTEIAVGPGKVDLLRQIDEMRSIAAAARALGMPYKRAWMLIDSLNQGFHRPVVKTATGGRGGGGASLTSLGRRLVAAYDALEERVNAGASAELKRFRSLAQ